MYHAHAHGDKAVPNGLFGTMYVGDVAVPAGRTISGIEIPADLTIAQDIPMVLNDAGVIGLTPQRQELPGDRAGRRRQGRLGHGHLLQRGPAGPPDAPPRLRAARLRQGRRARSTSPYAADTILVGSRRALHGAVPRRPASAPGSGTATSSTTSSPTTGMFGMVTAASSNRCELAPVSLGRSCDIW